MYSTYDKNAILNSRPGFQEHKKVESDWQSWCADIKNNGIVSILTIAKIESSYQIFKAILTMSHFTTIIASLDERYRVEMIIIIGIE